MVIEVIEVVSLRWISPDSNAAIMSLVDIPTALGL